MKAATSLLSLLSLLSLASLGGCAVHTTEANEVGVVVNVLTGLSVMPAQVILVVKLII